MAQHNFVSISVMPVDVRVAPDGEVQYTDAPERSADTSPEQVCQVCFVPLDPHSVNKECPGPRIPDNIAELMT